MSHSKNNQIKILEHLIRKQKINLEDPFTLEKFKNILANLSKKSPILQEVQESPNILKYVTPQPMSQVGEKVDDLSKIISTSVETIPSLKKTRISDKKDKTKRKRDFIKENIQHIKKKKAKKTRKNKKAFVVRKFTKAL